ncbi:MAG: hypothetical protein GY797_00135 [Deltaproteobacteria bacterium]|nr:hypothetical protein [Deltaproteobacteria bacterium]
MIQREIESKGIPTVGISIVRSYTEKIRPPRTIHLRWPFGHPLGEPFNIAQQITVLEHVFDALYSFSTPGEIADIKLKWKKENYILPKWLKDKQLIQAA